MNTTRIDDRQDGSSRGPPDPDGFPEEAFEHLAVLEDGNFWFRSRSKLITWAVERYFPRASRLLEIGCGTGVVLRAIQDRFPSLELVGVDASEVALHIAAGRVDAELVQLDARRMSFAEEFDVVCAFDVLEHIDEDETVLAQLAATMRSGGGLLLTVPQYRWLWSPADDYGRHRRRYTKREIHEKVERAGFTIVRSTAWVCTLLPVVALSRFRDRRAGAVYDPRRELEIPTTANRALELVLDLEVAAIRAGLSLPFGASRLVVAHKL